MGAYMRAAKFLWGEGGDPGCKLDLSQNKHSNAGPKVRSQSVAKADPSFLNRVVIG